jgi:hypothetical protein
LRRPRIALNRIIHIPLPGGDRKARAKGIRYAHGTHASAFRESVLTRSAAEAELREADRLERPISGTQREGVLACFDPWWPNLKIGVA